MDDQTTISIRVDDLTPDDFPSSSVYEASQRLCQAYKEWQRHRIPEPQNVGAVVTITVDGGEPLVAVRTNVDTLCWYATIAGARYMWYDWSELVELGDITILSEGVDL